MPTETRQAQYFCRECGRNTLHVATTDSEGLGCGTHVVLSIVTLGLWLPIGLVLAGLTSLGQTAGGLAPDFHCQVCGRLHRRNDPSGPPVDLYEPFPAEDEVDTPVLRDEGISEDDALGYLQNDEES